MILITWREEELITPKSIFSQSTVKNYTLRDNEFRPGITVCVYYESDMEKVIDVLEKTARNFPWRLPEPEPRVLLKELGDPSVIFGIYLNIDESWEGAKSSYV